MSARYSLLVVPAVAALMFSGCTTDKRLYSAEREEGRAAALDWWVGERIEASKLGPDGNPAVTQSEAAGLANDSLPRFVKHPDRWTLGYIKLIALKKDCYVWSVRFDRKGAFDDEVAADKFVKFYVLLDRSVVVPTLMYD